MKEKHPSRPHSLNWKASDVARWHISQRLPEENAEQEREPQVAKNEDDYELIWRNGKPVLPDWGTHSSPHNWKKLLGQLLRWAWGMWIEVLLCPSDRANNHSGRAHGVNRELKFPYAPIDENPEQFIDVKEYLPPPESLKEGRFIWKRVCDMPLDQIKPWVRLLLDRQERMKKEDIELFAFYPEKKKVNVSNKGKKRARVDAFDSDSDDENLEAEIEEALGDPELQDEPSEGSTRPAKSKVRFPAGDIQERPVIPGWDDVVDDGDGEEIDGEEDDEDGADLPIDESIDDAEDGSPASISAEWASRVEFLHSLSQEKAYTQMVKHLESIQVSPCSGFQHIYTTITLIP